MSTFLAASPSRILVWACSMSIYQVTTHSTHWIQPNKPPQKSQTPSTSYHSRCIVDSLDPTMNTSHLAPSATTKAALLPQKTTIKNKLDYINIHVTKKFQSHPKGTQRLLTSEMMIMIHNISA